MVGRVGAAWREGGMVIVLCRRGIGEAKAKIKTKTWLTWSESVRDQKISMSLLI